MTREGGYVETWVTFSEITLTGERIDDQVQGLDRTGVPVWIKVKDVAEALSEFYPVTETEFVTL